MNHFTALITVVMDKVLARSLYITVLLVRWHQLLELERATSILERYTSQNCDRSFYVWGCWISAGFSTHGSTMHVINS